MTTNASGRVLTEPEERLLQRIREMEGEINLLISDVRAVAAGVAGPLPDPGRHLALARTDFESGFMWLAKGLTRPTGGLGHPVL